MSPTLKEVILLGAIYRDKKYEEWLEAFGLEYLRCLSEAGFSEDEIAQRMGLEPEILYKWKRKHREFAEALALGRPDSDFHVINALYRKATGFNVELKKTYKLKKIDFDPDTGKKIREYEELATGVDETFIPADLSAEKYWLESRQGEKWSRSSRNSDATDGGGGGVVIIPEADSIDGVDEESGCGEADMKNAYRNSEEYKLYIEDFEENRDLVRSPYGVRSAFAKEEKAAMAVKSWRSGGGNEGIE